MTWPAGRWWYAATQRSHPRPGPAGQPVLLRTPDAGPAIDGVHRLGLHEHSVLRAFLSRPGVTPEQRQALASTMARTLHDRLGLAPAAPERSWPAELFLERLYLQLSQGQARPCPQLRGGPAARSLTDGSDVD